MVPVFFLAAVADFTALETVEARLGCFCGALLAAVVALRADPLLLLLLSFAAGLLLVPALVVAFFEVFLLLVLLVRFVFLEDFLEDVAIMGK